MDFVVSVFARKGLATLGTRNGLFLWQEPPAEVKAAC